MSSFADMEVDFGANSDLGQKVNLLITCIPLTLSYKGGHEFPPPSSAGGSFVTTPSSSNSNDSFYFPPLDNRLRVQPSDIGNESNPWDICSESNPWDIGSESNPWAIQDVPTASYNWLSNTLSPWLENQEALLPSMQIAGIHPGVNLTAPGAPFFDATSSTHLYTTSTNQSTSSVPNRSEDPYDGGDEEEADDHHRDSVSLSLCLNSTSVTNTLTRYRAQLYSIRWRV